MQTFITSLNLEQSAYSLWENGVSGNRLQNQINEGLIILRTLTGWYAKRGRKGWPNHPATKIWEHHTGYLANYVYEHIRKYELLSGNKCNKRYDDLYDAVLEFGYANQMPAWLTEEFCSNHRSVLLGKALELADQKEAVLDRAIALGNFEKNKVNFRNTLKANRAYHKACLVWQWYKSHNWAEQPAIRDENGKWPYTWPVKE